MERNIPSRWIALIAIAIIAPALAQPAPTAPAVTDEQKAKTEKIDKYIEQQRQFINFYYDNQLVQIRANKADAMRRLTIINPDLYVRAGFIGLAEYVQNCLALRGIDLMSDPQFAETFRDLHDGGGGLTETEKLDLAPRLLSIAEDRFAREENRTLLGYDAAELKLAKERDYALNVQLKHEEEHLKNNALNPPAAKPAGLVSGILYSGEKSAAIVGSQIVHNGDKLDSVKVAKINSDSVEFDKSGRTWTQKVGEAPSAMWQ